MRQATVRETMVVVASREIREGEVVFAGTGLPMLACMLAQRTHAPGAHLVFEAGAVDPRLEALPRSVGDIRTLKGAAQAVGLDLVFSFLLQAGRVDLGFLGAAQVDRYGNLGSIRVGGSIGRPGVRFSGSGGAADVASLAGRTVVIVPHERRRFPERVDHRTSPGWLEGGDSREKAGLSRGGPEAVVTTLGVIRFDPVTKDPWLASCHPGVTPESVQEETEFLLDLSRVEPTREATREELATLREEVDPERLFLGLA